MEIKNIKFNNEGIIRCHSRFYSAQDRMLKDSFWNFSQGVNTLYGEIDSGMWSSSYFLSMYSCRCKDFTLFNEPIVTIDGEDIFVWQLDKFSCYMDFLYPLFSKKLTIHKSLQRGLNKSGLRYSPEEILDLFQIKPIYLKCSPKQTGTEVFKVLAAIGYSFGKSIFCFPWMSQSRFDSYHENIKWLLNKLSELNAIVILPLGRT